MIKRMIIPMIFGLGGVAVLLSLGVWQMQRLSWKEAVLADIDVRIVAVPVALPETPDPERDRYLPVVATGQILAEELDVLVSIKHVGPGFRVISPFLTEDGRRIMVDRGFVSEIDKDTARPAIQVTLIGNLHWPNEVDGFTPAPDLGRNIWFARDVDAMATALETEPLLLILRETSENDPSVSPLPVTTVGISNDHLNYAITWFSLAALWLGMTLYLLWRIRQRTI
jgi:surfeit locus 1 family protein